MDGVDYGKHVVYGKILALMAIYENTVDKVKYPSFYEWVTERKCTLCIT